MTTNDSPKFEIWEFFDNVFNFATFHKKKLLNKNNFNNTEQAIFNIAAFHLNQKGIVNTNDTYIDFSIETENYNFKIDFNKYVKKYPILSIFTFLDDDVNPLILTGIDLEMYKFKEIPSDPSFRSIIPSKNSQIVVDTSKYYGFYKINDKNSRILKINIWDFDITSQIPLYISENSANTEIVINNSSTISLLNIHTQYENVVYKNMIEFFLYEEDNKQIFILDNIFKKYEKNSTILISNRANDYYDIDILKEKYGDVAYDIAPFVNKFTHDDYDIKSNRFYKNKIIQNILSKDICYWIINECEKVNFEISKYHNYNTYLNIEKMPSILNFLLFITNFWLLDIKKIYGCENIAYNMYDIFVSKYTKDTVCLDKHQDNSFLTLNIYLNDIIDYKDGEIIFEDESEKIHINQGDMLIYNGKKMRTNGSVSDGVKYILVIMIEVSA